MHNCYSYFDEMRSMLLSNASMPFSDECCWLLLLSTLDKVCYYLFAIAAWEILLPRSYTLWNTIVRYLLFPTSRNSAWSNPLSAVASIIFSTPLILLRSASTPVELCVTSWLFFLCWTRCTSRWDSTFFFFVPLFRSWCRCLHTRWFWYFCCISHCCIQNR